MGTNGGRVIEIAAPKDLLHSARGRMGPMLDEVKRDPKTAVMTTSPDPEGGMMLNFGLATIGDNPHKGSRLQRVSHALEIIVQLDRLAAKYDQVDPRISIFGELDKENWTHDFAVSFERPADADDAAVAEKIRAGMFRAAKLLKLYVPTYNMPSDYVRAIDDPEGLYLDIVTGHYTDQETRSGHSIRTKILASSTTNEDPNAHRIELIGKYKLSGDDAKLTALAGILSTLDPIR
jgi:hypothetical protein